MYQTLYPLIKQYGSHALSVSTLQPCCKQFYFNSGYIAYTASSYSNHVYVLGDPICNTTDTTSLLKAFIETFPNSTFVHISNSIATQLKELGYSLNIFGEEHIVEPRTASLTWRSHKSLRRESNKASRSGIVVKQIHFTDLEHYNYKDISKKWVSTRKNNRKQQFLTRPLPTSSEPDTLYFGAFSNNQLVGFSILSPMYKDNHIVGYYADITRYIPQYSQALYLLHYQALLYLRQHGIPELSLGLSFFDIEKQHQTYSHPFIKRLLFSIMKWGNFLYAFKSLYLFKKRFHGKKVPMYIASKSSLPILDLLHLFWITTRQAK